MTTVTAPTYSSVTVDGMRALVHAMVDARDELRDALDVLAAPMRSAGLPTSVLSQIDVVAAWIDERLPDLDRRLNLARGLARHTPDGEPVRIDEEGFVTTDRAREIGRELALMLDTGPDAAASVVQIRSDLAPYVDDPDVTTSFVSNLGMDKIDMLPRIIAHARVSDGRSLLATFSRTLATALSVPHPGSTILDIRQQFTNPPESTDQSWDRLALLQDGAFPPRWLADSVRANALDEFIAGARFPVDYGSSKLRLSGSRFALGFFALRNNPAAARLALDHGGHSIADAVRRVYRLDELNMCHPDVPRTFGLALEAAAEADHVRRTRGRDAERFAFDLVVASTTHRVVPATIRESLERVAAGYMPEFVAGSYADAGAETAGITPSATERPHDLPAIDGLQPSFYLTPDITVGFIGSFQRHVGLGLAGPFSDAMGASFERLLDDAIAADHRDGGARTEDVMYLFGAVNTLVYTARRDHAADFEAERHHLREQIAKIIGGVLSIPSLSRAGHLLWGAVQNVVNHVTGSWSDTAGEATDDIESTHAAAERLMWFFVVDRLIDHDMGREALAEAPDGIVVNGSLRPIAEIFADSELRRRFYEWVNDHDELDDAADAAQRAWNAGATSAGAALSGVPATP